jgi:segregation and condensation protein A
MAEKTVPWWRRALNYALEGIRAGFGLFPRAGKPSHPEEPDPLHTQDAPLEEERVLTLQPANPEAIAAEAAATPEPVPVVVLEHISAAEPEHVAVAEPILPQEPLAKQTPDPARSPVIATDPAPSNEPVAEAIAEPAVAAEPASEPLVAPPAPPVTVLVSIPEVPHLDPIAELPSEAAVVVDSPQPSAPEQPAADEPIVEPVAEPASGPELTPSAAPEIEVAYPAAKTPTPSVAVLEPESTLEPPPDLASIPETDFATKIELRAEPAAERITSTEPATEPEPAQIIPVSEPSIETLTVTEAAPVIEPAPVAQPTLAALSHVPAPATEAQTAAPPEPIAAPEITEPQTLAPTPVQDERTAAKLAARQKKLDAADEQSPFSVVVGQVYDGPLDLLLDLIRQQDIDIYDIPISKITAQFLAYVNQLKASDVDVAGEFIYTASLLIHIKSKMLLPRAPSGPDDAAEDPRRELVERLLEHERFKNAAQMLQQKQMLEAVTWTNPGFREFKDDAAAEPEIAADTVDLVRIFRDILERARKRPVFNLDEDSVTVGQMMQYLARRLTMEDKPVALRRLLSHTRSERALIAMFLALLELVRLQAILLRQDRQFSEIFIKKHTAFDTVMNEGLANAPHDDWR